MADILSYRLPEHLRARRLAKRRESGVQIAGLIIAGVCLIGAGMFMTPMNTIRRERQLVIDPESLGNLPPDIQLLGKLGTFRALAIDWAAIRAERLKEEGKTYEALQLYDTICRLAPRFPQVWANAAWNMAYNISVAQYTPEARWKWVRNGIEILRDEGLKYNRRSITLYRELTWIYWHKIGGIMDDEHLNYKRALAVEMEGVLGPPPVTLEVEEYFDWFRQIATAPDRLEDLLGSDAAVALLVERLKHLDLSPDESLLEYVARHLRPELRTDDLIEEQRGEKSLQAARTELLTDPDQGEALERLLATVRSEVLQERYKFDPDWMLHLMEDEYGPLDWRNTFAHGLYWSSRGEKMSTGYENTDFTDAVNTSRLVLFALQSLVDRGRMVLYPDFDDPFSSYLDLTPDTRFIPYLYDLYLRVSKRHFSDKEDFVEGKPYRIFMNGFVTAMHNWIQYLYFEGGRKNLELAENYYAWLRENNPHPDGTTQSRYLKTLDEFVMGDVLNQLHTYRAASGLIRSLIFRGLKQFALGQLQAGVTSLDRARLCYNYWMQDADTDRNDRMKMQPLLVILRDEIQEYMNKPEIGPLFKARLWNNLPLEQRQMTYDQLRPVFDRLCEGQDPPWSLRRAFPEPPGMAEAREWDIETIGAPRREGVDVGKRYKD